MADKTKEEEKAEEDQRLGESSQPLSQPDPEPQTPPETELDEDRYADKNPYINTTSPYTTPGMSSPKKRSPKKLLLALGVIVLLLVLGNFARGKLFNSASKASPTPTPTVMESPSPSPEVSVSPSASPSPTSTSKSSVDKTSGLDRAKLSVQIENGSGKTGVAGTASTYLTGLGYNVILTGNADNFNYTGVTVRVKSLKSDFLTLLKSDLNAKYTVSSATSDLSATSSADALIIIGK